MENCFVFLFPLAPWEREKNRFEFGKRKPDFTGEGFIEQSCHCSGVNAVNMSLRANVSERGNPINIICQLVICPIRKITTHSSNVRNDMKLCSASNLFN